MANSKIESSNSLSVLDPAGTVVSAQASVLRFLGAGVSVAQVGDQTQVTIPGGGGGLTGDPFAVPYFDAGGAVQSDDQLLRFRYNSLMMTPGLGFGVAQAERSFIASNVSVNLGAGCNILGSVLVSPGIISLQVNAGDTPKQYSPLVIGQSSGTVTLAYNTHVQIQAGNFLSNYRRPNDSGEFICIGNLAVSNHFFTPIDMTHVTSVGHQNSTSNGAPETVIFGNFINASSGTEQSAAPNGPVIGVGSNLTVGSIAFGYPEIVMGRYNELSVGGTFCVAQFGVGDSLNPATAWVVRDNNKSFEPLTLNLNVNIQSPVNGYTVDPVRSCIDLDNGGAFILNATDAIDDGDNDGQEITLRQVGTGSTQIDHGANVLNNGGGNVILTQGSTITYSWSLTLNTWLEKSRSII